MAELEEGRVIGSYRVVRCIGQGGMGTVYEVEHVELGVHYALKTFTFDPANDARDALKTKFLEEGKVLARLKHPNIAHVFDLAFDEETQMPYFVMDLVTYEDGESYTAEDVDLSDIDEEVVYGWFKELASALDYIHEQGIVHRDIKPGNLLMDKDAHVVLTDFGISRIFGAKLKTDVDATRTMASKTGRGKLVLGTEKYIAPEVERGEEAVPESDAYSLGVMVLRWLTGFFYKDNPGALGLLSKKKYLWLPVIARLLAPTPDRRPKTYSDLVKQLKPIAHVGAASCRINGGGKDASPTKKKRNKTRENILAAVAGLFIVAVLAAGGYFAWRYVEKKGAERDCQVAELKRQMAADKAAAEKKEAEEKAEAARKAAEEKRIAEEKSKRETERKAALARQRQDEENAREKIAKNANAPVRDSSVDAASSPRQSGDKTSSPTKREFIQEAVVTTVQNYGPIPNKKYTWLMNGNADAPQKQIFQLANGAKLELMPFRAATFSMTNEEGDPKGWHEVTLTRPFWMSKSCVTVDQWREFAPNDCEDCREVEKALGGQALLYIRLPRKSIDEFCAYLTAKYRIKLPKGYVFRLPSEAEWEYAMDFEATFDKYHKPDVMSWVGFVGIGSITFRDRFASVRFGKAALQQIREDGWWEGSRYRVCGLSLPHPSGIMDMIGEHRWTLDIHERDFHWKYHDIMVDPLMWCDGLYDERKACVITRGWERNREPRSFGNPCLCHIVVGPDLIGERAWENKRENVEVKANVPRQAKKFDPKRIPPKISKPREITLKRVGGIETVFCEIPKGKFNMSNVNGQAKQCHKVELTRPFWMSKFLVTSSEWREYAPADFKTRAVKAAERLFPKNPVCVNNPYHRWTAYCEFLNRRYGHLLPPGYVFRLPTEAEWEWAFIADEKGDVRRMDGALHNCGENQRQEFDVLMKKARVPKELRYDNIGIMGHAYIGGRTPRNGFGVYDFAIRYWGRDQILLDTFDTSGQINEDGNEDGYRGDPKVNISYQEKEIDPIRYAGRCARFSEIRTWDGCRSLLNYRNHTGCAHIVIAPDILKPLKEKEVAEFPMEDFGGAFLGDSATRADQSSKHDSERRNNDKLFKRMVSRENIVVAKFDKGEDTRGFHTGSEDSPWIMIDLGKRCEIMGLCIDGLWGCTRHLCIWVSDDGKHEKLVDKEELMRKRYRIDLQKKNVKGRYIRIGREPKIEKNWFFLDKVVIYGKEK